jgi:hypothetical protein
MTTERPTQETPVIPVITREALPDSGAYRWSWLSNGKVWTVDEGQLCQMAGGPRGTVSGVHLCGDGKAPLILVACENGDAAWGRLEERT